MNKIDNVIKTVQNRKSIGLMGHIIAGYPNDKTALDAAMGLADGGADFIEVQFPFSDPTADGPTIESACYQSLKDGFTVEKGFNLVKKLASQTDVAILIMSYGNIPYKYGLESFIKKSVECGVSGLIIPDLTLPHDENYADLSARYNMSNIYVVAPGADDDRIKALSKKGNGFLYTVTRRGITGQMTEMDSETLDWIENVKKNSTLPLAVGFGIRSAAQIKILEGHCDIAIIGSHFVKTINQALSDGNDIRTTLAKETADLLS